MQALQQLRVAAVLVLLTSFEWFVRFTPAMPALERTRGTITALLGLYVAMQMWRGVSNVRWAFLIWGVLFSTAFVYPTIPLPGDALASIVVVVLWLALLGILARQVWRASNALGNEPHAGT